MAAETDPSCSPSSAFLIRATNVPIPRGAQHSGLGSDRRWQTGSGRRTGSTPRTWHPLQNVSCVGLPPSGMLTMVVAPAGTPSHAVPKSTGYGSVPSPSRGGCRLLRLSCSAGVLPPNRLDW